ncbi:hypothetical protein ES703_29761 [subsurface metagenome]
MQEGIGGHENRYLVIPAFIVNVIDLLVPCALPPVWLEARHETVLEQSYSLIIGEGEGIEVHHIAEARLDGIGLQRGCYINEIGMISAEFRDHITGDISHHLAIQGKG